MLIIDVSKTRSTSQRLELDGDGIDYVIQLDWSTRYQRFFMEIYDSEKNLLTAGIKLVPGSPINTGNKDSNGPQGLFIVSGTGSLTRESFDNEGYRLYYFPRSEATTFPLITEYLAVTDFQEYIEEEAPEPPNLFDGFFVTAAQTGQPISPVLTTFSGDDTSWIWGDGETTSLSNTPTHPYTDEAVSHEVDTYSVAAEDFKTINLKSSYVTDVSLGTLKNLTSIDVSDNAISTINTLGISELTYLDFRDNLVYSFQLEGLEKLEECYAQNNQLTEIAPRSVSSLKILNVSNNNITAADPSQATALEELYVSDNPIGTLDPTSNSVLTVLEAANCGLSELDISQNALTRLVASGNGLSTISNANLGACGHLEVQDNNIIPTVVDNTVISLDANGISNGTLAIEDNNNPTLVSYDEYLSLLAKGWNVTIDPYPTIPPPEGYVYVTIAGHFDGGASNYLSQPSNDFGLTNALSIGAVVNFEEAPLVPIGYPVNSVYFGNENGRCDIPRNIANNATQFAVSMWIEASDISDQMLYRSEYTAGAANIWIRLFLGNVEFMVRGIDNVYYYATSPSAIPLDEMVHITCDWVGNAYMKIYVNGVLVATETSTLPSSIDTGVGTVTTVGRQDFFPFEREFIGWMSYLCDFYNTSGLSQSDVNKLYNGGTAPCFDIIDPLLVDEMSGFWNLSTTTEDPSSVLTDKVGSADITTELTLATTNKGLTAECGTAPSTETQTILSKGTFDTDGYSLIRNGDNTVSFNLVTGEESVINPVNSANLNLPSSYITGTKSTALELTGDQTWSIRVKPNDITGVNQLMTLNFSAPSGRATNLRFLSGSLELLGYPDVGVNSFVIHTSSETFSVGSWYHIVMTTDATSNTHLYVNGVKESFGGVGSVLGNDPLLGIAIGTVTGGGAGMGFGNRVQVWNRMLSDAEVAEDYNGSATEYVCYDKQVADGSTLITGKILDVDMSEDTLIDHTGNSTLSENEATPGDITYTDQGQSAECGGSATSNTITYATPLVEGTPYTIDATFDSTEGFMRLYVDKALTNVGGGNGNSISVSTEDLKIGEGLTGCLQFPYVANSKYTDAEIAGLRTPTGLLPFYDLPTSVTDDMIGHWNVSNWNNGKNAGSELLNNVPSPGSVPVIYPVNSANFDTSPSTAYSKTPISALATSFGISAWVKRDTLGGIHHIYRDNKDNAGNHRIALFVESDNFIDCYIEGILVTFPLVIDANTWYHLVVDYVGSTYMRLYIDGVLLGNVAASVPASISADGASPVCGIGYDPNGTVAYGLDGYMSQVIDFKNHGGFSQAEVDELFEYKCIENYSAPLSAKMSSGYELADWTGNVGNGAVDKIGSDNLVPFGVEPAYDGTGLSVECDETVANDLVDNGTVPFDCTGADVFDSEGPYTP